VYLHSNLDAILLLDSIDRRIELYLTHVFSRNFFDCRSMDLLSIPRSICFLPKIALTNHVGFSRTTVKKVALCFNSNQRSLACVNFAVHPVALQLFVRTHFSTSFRAIEPPNQNRELSFDCVLFTKAGCNVQTSFSSDSIFLWNYNQSLAWTILDCQSNDQQIWGIIERQNKKKTVGQLVARISYLYTRTTNSCAVDSFVSSVRTPTRRCSTTVYSHELE
jgi:hypothetical protein